MIAFSMKYNENGLIPAEDGGGLGQRACGSKDVHDDSPASGIGKPAGRGGKRAAQKFGSGSKEFVAQGKGMEGPAHDPRSGKALAVADGTSNRDMCHIRPL